MKKKKIEAIRNIFVVVVVIIFFETQNIKCLLFNALNK